MPAADSLRALIGSRARIPQHARLCVSQAAARSILAKQTVFAVAFWRKGDTRALDGASLRTRD